jgi:polyphosphate glucokinase
LRYGERRVFELLGDSGMEELGEKKWQKAVHDIVPVLKNAMMADYVVLGGGSVKLIEELPDGVRRGHNRTVVEGGRRLWEELPDPVDDQRGEWIVR